MISDILMYLEELEQHQKSSRSIIFDWITVFVDADVFYDCL